MADFESFATGFISRLNQQQADRMKAKREDESTAKAADRAMALKAYYADVDSYTQAQSSRAPIESMLSAGQGNALFVKLSEGKTKEEIKNLRAIFDSGDEASILSLVNSAYAVPEKPDIKSSKYTGEGFRSNQRLMDEKSDYAKHPLARLLGWTGNKHLDKRARRGGVAPEEMEAEAPVERPALEFTLPATEELEAPTKNPINLYGPKGERITRRADSPEVDQLIAQGFSTERPPLPLKAIPLDAKAMASVRGTVEALKSEPGPYRDFMEKFDEADSGAGDERDQILNELYQEISGLRADRRYTDEDIGTLTGIAINQINPRIVVKKGMMFDDVIVEPRGGSGYPIMTPEEVAAAPSGTRFTVASGPNKGKQGVKP